MRFCVIIPSYKSENTILACIESLKAQTFKDFEVICVDSTPNQNVKKIIEDNSNYKIIHLNQKTLSEVARNIAAKETNAEILVYIDSDCVADKSWLMVANEEFNKGCDALSGPVKCFGNKFFDITLHLAKFWLWLPESNKSYVETAPTANFAIKRNLFFELGGFNNSYLSSADSGLCYALKENNKKIIFNNNFSVYHIHDSTFGNSLRERYIRGYEFGILRVDKLNFTKIKSLLFFVSSPFLPFLKYIIKFLKLKKSGFGLIYLKGFFFHILLEYAWILGEAKAFWRILF